MYKFSVLLLFAVTFLIACHSKNKSKGGGLAKFAMAHPAHTINPVTDRFPVTNPHLKEFQSFLKGLDLNTANNAVVAAKKFDEIFRNDEVSIRDTAFVLFNRFHFDLSMGIDDMHDKDSTIQYDSLLTDSAGKHSSQITPKTAQYEQVLKANGLRVTSEEGETYIEQDLNFEVNWFKDKLSSPVQQYLIQTAKEGSEGLAEDMGLIISPKKLAERTIWWENYVNNYPGIIVSIQAKNNYMGDLEILLTGLDNSPVLNHSPFSLNDSYAQAYAFLQEHYPNSQTNQLVKPYYRLLSQKDSAGAAKLLEAYVKQRIIAKPDDEVD